MTKPIDFTEVQLTAHVRELINVQLELQDMAVVITEDGVIITLTIEKLELLLSAALESRNGLVFIKAASLKTQTKTPAQA